MVAEVRKHQRLFRELGQTISRNTDIAEGESKVNFGKERLDKTAGFGRRDIVREVAQRVVHCSRECREPIHRMPL